MRVTGYICARMKEASDSRLITGALPFNMKAFQNTAELLQKQIIVKEGEKK
jgi:hypothetical protein